MPDLHEQLLAEEGSAILGWAVQGAVDVLAGGLQDPRGVGEATREYEISEDTLTSFVRTNACSARTGGLRSATCAKRYEDHCARWESIHSAQSTQHAASQ